MKGFSFIQKWRNKIRMQGLHTVSLASTVKLVNCKIEIKGSANSLIIHSGATLRNVQIEILGDNSLIEIGQNSIIGDSCYLSAKESTSLTIGEESMFSRNVKVMTSDGHPIYQDNRVINSAKDINIGKRCWCGDNVTILKGVSVGSGSVVGINSTLTHSIEENVVAVGNPAKVVKENISWEH